TTYVPTFPGSLHPAYDANPPASVVKLVVASSATKVNVPRTPGTALPDSSTTRTTIGAPRLDGSLVCVESPTASSFLGEPGASVSAVDPATCPAENVMDAAPDLPTMVSPVNVALPPASVGIVVVPRTTRCGALAVTCTPLLTTSLPY